MAQSATRSFADIYRKQRLPIVGMLFISLGLFAAGLFRPFTAVTKLWVFENKVSVFQGLITLARESEYFLFAILFVFTALFPLIKIIFLLLLWLRRGLNPKQVKRLYGFVANLGKWSMLDVFVVAVLVIMLRSGGIAEISVQDGLFLFCASVLLTQIASIWTGRIARRFVESGD